MSLTLRPGKPEDVTVCGAICYEAFKAIAHNITPAFERDGFLVPLRHKELLSRCLARGFRVAVPQTPMSQGFYQEPVGAFLPSVLY
jgi:hypothetical protein